MTIEDFFKEHLRKSKLSIKDAAKVCSYKEQSMRNKFIRHSLNVRDIVNICQLLGYRLAIIAEEDTPNSAFVFQIDDLPEPLVSANDSIGSEREIKIIISPSPEFRKNESVNDESSSVPEFRKKENVNDESSSLLDSFMQEGTAMCEIVHSPNLGYLIVSGKQCKDASKALKIYVGQGHSAETEMLMCKIISDHHGVTIKPAPNDFSAVIKEMGLSI